MSRNIRITGAGAGTGKTHQLCEIVSDALASGACRPGGFIATTFTRKAAAELTERVRKRLLEGGLNDAALRVEEALVGTMHSVCTRIVGRFAFEAGISPRLRVMDESMEKALLGCAVEACFSLSDIGRMEVLAKRLGQVNQRKFESNWKNQVRELIACARSNAIDPGALDDMARRSLDRLLAYFPKPAGDDLETALGEAIQNAVSMIALGDDKTKKTADCVEDMGKALRSLRQESCRGRIGASWRSSVRPRRVSLMLLLSGKLPRESMNIPGCGKTSGNTPDRSINWHARHWRSIRNARKRVACSTMRTWRCWRWN